MAYQIIWTAEADNDLYNILNYLKDNWSLSIAEKFAKRTLRRLNRLAAEPFKPRLTSKPGIHMIKLDRKNVLFFTVENNHLVLLSIYPYNKDITKSRYY